MTRPVAIFKRLWRRAPWLTLATVLAFLLALVFALRFGFAVWHWVTLPTDPELAGWMTPRFVAHAWDLPPEVLLQALPMDTAGSGRRVTLARAGAGPRHTVGAASGNRASCHCRAPRGRGPMTETLFALGPVTGCGLSARRCSCPVLRCRSRPLRSCWGPGPLPPRATSCCGRCWHWRGVPPWSVTRPATRSGVARARCCWTGWRAVHRARG